MIFIEKSINRHLFLEHLKLKVINKIYIRTCLLRIIFIRSQFWFLIFKKINFKKRKSGKLKLIFLLKITETCNKNYDKKDLVKKTEIDLLLVE